MLCYPKRGKISWTVRAFYSWISNLLGSRVLERTIWSGRRAGTWSVGIGGLFLLFSIQLVRSEGIPVNIISRSNNGWLFPAVLPVWVWGRTSTNAGGWVEQTRQSTLRANNLLCRMERVAFEVRLSAFENGSFCLDSNVFKIIRVHRSLCSCLRAKSGGLFFGFLSSKYHSRAHVCNLLVTMSFEHDVMNNIVERVIENVACLLRLDTC